MLSNIFKLFSMYILLSPAKSLDFSREVSALPTLAHKPAFTKQTARLHKVLKELSEAEIAKLMHISPKLASLNYERFQNWTPSYVKQKFDADGQRSFDVALRAFTGDVYQHFSLETYKKSDWIYADKHIGILSGYYGILSPLTYMKPYRLEMGTKLSVTPAKNADHGSYLYAFWGSQITDHINEILAKQKKSDRIVVNLASKEYAKVVQFEDLDARIIEPVFKVFSDGKYKVVGIRAKKARGAMADRIVRERIASVEDLKKVAVEGFRYDVKLSTDSQYVYTMRT